jgi:hypothetical protein
MPEDIAFRRARRADHMVFGKARNFAEHAEQGIAFWKEVPIGNKFDVMVELVRDSWHLGGNDGLPPRLDRSAHGVRKLRG